MTRRTTPPAGGRAGAAIGRLDGRREVGRGASSKSVMLVRHVLDDFVDFLPLHTILFERSEFLIATCKKKKTDRLSVVCMYA